MGDEKNYCVLIDDSEFVIKSLVPSLEKRYNVFISKDLGEALSFIASHNTQISFCIMHYSITFEERLLSLIEKIKTINPFIVKVLIGVSDLLVKSRREVIKKYSIVTIDTKDFNTNMAEKIERVVEKHLRRNKRTFSRVDWPLNVKISSENSGAEPIMKNIVSISGSGAFIYSDDFMPKKDDYLILNVSFKDFNFLTKASVVWLNDQNQNEELPIGFAVIFLDVGTASQNVIENIIKDRIVKKTLFEFKSEL